MIFPTIFGVKQGGAAISFGKRFSQKAPHLYRAMRDLTADDVNNNDGTLP